MNNDCFKVRIWNVSGGYYLPEFYLTPAGEVCEFGVFNGTPQVRKFDNQENYRKERCTGLTDKNGRLIYEGDVLRRSWGDKIDVATLSRLPKYWLEHEEFGWEGEELEEPEYWEIIGNVHEMEVPK